MADTKSGESTITVSDPQKHGGIRKFVDYAVVTRVKGLKEFSVRRRYSNFVALREALLAEFPGCPIAMLPPKSIRLSLTSSFVGDRAKGLEIFLDCILFNPILAKSNYLRTFLCTKGSFKGSRESNVDPAQTAAKLPSIIKIKELANYAPPAYADIGACTNGLIDKQLIMITKYIRELNKFLFVSSSAVSALEQTKQGSDDVVKELEHLKAKEEKYSKNSQDYKRFDLSKMVVNMKEILGKSPQSFSSIVRCFHQDLLLCQGVLQAIEFRKNLATRLKKALKVEEHWKAKPPTTPQAKQKRQKHQETLGHLSAALDITDKLLIEVHLPGIFKDMQHRFGIAAKRVIKDHLALTRRMISFWKTTQEELGCF